MPKRIDRRALLERAELASKRISARKARQDFESVARMPDSEWDAMDGAEKSEAMYALIGGATLLVNGAKQADAAMVLANELQTRPEFQDERTQHALRETLRMRGI